MICQSQRGIIVRPCEANERVAPIQEEVGDLEVESGIGEDVVVQEDEGEAKEGEIWQEVRDKTEDLTVRVARHFEDENDKTEWKTPMVGTPPQPTKDEWSRHQLIHTPFAPWCKHCSAGRAVRTSHQRADKRAKFVPDTDKSTDGPVKISMDYMYICTIE